MIGLSVFLMMPVASAFSALFLEDVAQAVEDMHYPHLPPVPRQRFADTAIATVNFVALVAGVNLAALTLAPFAGPLIVPLFWAVNGALLGREYFAMAATRRIGRKAARDLARRHSRRIWVAGLLMTVPLTVPFLNLVIPVLGAATFTHLFHRLMARAG